MSNEDLSAVDFSRLLSKLPERLPISDAYDARRPGSIDSLSEQHWYSSPKQSMVSWYEDLESPDGSTRRRRSLEAKIGWNRSLSPQGMLWIAEALGEESAILNEAASEAGHHKRLASQCAAIRRVIPWARVAELLNAYRLSTQGNVAKGAKNLAKGAGSKLTGWPSGRRRDC